jgi:glycosyltransferase involved in cell wall biosynthesis
MKDTPHISIIIPAFDEENNIEKLYKELVPVVESLNKNFEVIFIDDGSRDNSFEVIKRLNDKDPRVSGLSLSRNFGHQVALIAGIEQASGEVVVMMDADFQHPPEVIRSLYQKYQDGFDIVNTKRIETQGVLFFKRISSWCYYKLINTLSDFRIEASSSDFRLMNRKAVEAFMQFQEKNRFNRGLISWMGFKQDMVEYKARSRIHGRSKYTLRKMLSLGLDGITSFSSKPLRLSFYTGFLIFLAGIAYAIYVIISHFKGLNIPGWTSTILIILLVGGFQLLSLGIIGEYIARIYNESKSRPIYFLKDRVGKNS